jgi:hypothetical protein
MLSRLTPWRSIVDSGVHDHKVVHLESEVVLRREQRLAQNAAGRSWNVPLPILFFLNASAWSSADRGRSQGKG